MQIERTELSADEIRTMTIFMDGHKAAKAQMRMAEQQQLEYMEQLRRKYGLGPEWMLLDVLQGFVRPVQEPPDAAQEAEVVS